MYSSISYQQLIGTRIVKKIHGNTNQTDISPKFETK